MHIIGTSGPRSDNDLPLTAKQDLILQAIFNHGYRFLLFGGAIRGAKTFGLIIVAAVLCKVFKGSRWAIVRKDMPSLKSTVIPTYNKVREMMFPRFLGPVKYTSPVMAQCANGSQIIFWPESYKDDKDYDRFKGLEVNGFLPDEVNELQPMAFDKMMERAGTHIITPMPPALIIASCNPNKLWPKDMFYDKWKQGILPHPYGYIPAGPLDNPFLPDEFLENLRALKDRNPIHYAKYVLGDWDVSEGDIFKPEDFEYKKLRLDPSVWHIEVFADIAYTAKPTSDYCSFGLAGINQVAQRHMFEQKLERMTEKDSLDYIFRKHRMYLELGVNPVWRIEAHSAYLAAIVERQKVEDLYFTFTQLKHGGVNKVDRILNRRSYLQHWTYDPSCRPLVEQHLEWSPELIDVVPDDGPDMNAYADVALKYDPNQLGDYDPRPKDPILAELYDVMNNDYEEAAPGMR